jgi:hypothetical protein
MVCCEPITCRKDVRDMKIVRAALQQDGEAKSYPQFVLD